MTISSADVLAMVPFARRLLESAPTGSPDGVALASADDCSITGLAMAHVNSERRKDGWCACAEGQAGAEVYFREVHSGVHGWMCGRCRGVVQFG